MNFKVSIILPNYNSFKTIKSTIKSIQKQSYKNWELIIVDDCSGIETRHELENFKNNKKIKILYLEKNKGAAFCRNLAIKKSNSKYLAFIDSDDNWKKDKLKQQIKFMIKNNYDFTYTYYRSYYLEENKQKLIKTPKKFTFNEFIKNTSIGTSTMMVKSSIAKKFKFINTPICEDYFYKCQLLKKTKFAYCLPFPLTRYLIRHNSLQSNKIKNLFWIWKINKKFNKLNFFSNLISIFFISLNSLKKYGFK